MPQTQTRKMRKINQKLFDRAVSAQRAVESALPSPHELSADVDLHLTNRHIRLAQQDVHHEIEEFSIFLMKTGALVLASTYVTYLLILPFIQPDFHLTNYNADDYPKEAKLQDEIFDIVSGYELAGLAPLVLGSIGYGINRLFKHKDADVSESELQQATNHYRRI